MDYMAYVSLNLYQGKGDWLRGVVSSDKFRKDVQHFLWKLLVYSSNEAAQGGGARNVLGCVAL